MFRIFNLHFTDLCDFHCVFCFVKKQGKMLDKETCFKVVDRIDEYFHEKSITDGRINIAGGEPFTCNYLQELVDYIHSKGIRISMITNGYKLTKEFIIKNKDSIEQIGISIDSIKHETNLKLGRADKELNTFDMPTLVSLCNEIKANNIRMKINVVASKLNQDEDIKPLLDCVKPDRFKVLQLVPTNPYAETIKLSEDEYKTFVKKYESYGGVRETSDDITNAYVIIDSEGKITTNNLHNSGYDIIDHKISEVEDRINFSQENEDKRYV